MSRRPAEWIYVFGYYYGVRLLSGPPVNFNWFHRVTNHPGWLISDLTSYSARIYRYIVHGGDNRLQTAAATGCSVRILYSTIFILFYWLVKWESAATAYNRAITQTTTECLFFIYSFIFTIPRNVSSAPRGRII